MQYVVASGADSKYCQSFFPKPAFPYALSHQLVDNNTVGTFGTLGLDEKTLWRRKHARAVFAQSNVRLSVPSMNEHTDALFRKILALPLENGGPGRCCDMHHELLMLGLDSFGGSSLGGYAFNTLTGPDDSPGSVLMRDLPPLYEEVFMKGAMFWRPFLPLWASPGRSDALQGVTTTCSVFRDIVKYGRTVAPEKLRGTLLGAMLSMKDAGATEAEVESEVNMYVIAGHETSACELLLGLALSLIGF